MTIPGHGLRAASSKKGPVTLFPHGKEQWLRGGPFVDTVGGLVLDSTTVVKRRRTMFAFTFIHTARYGSLTERAHCEGKSVMKAFT